MIQTMIRNWWLLAVCGVLNAAACGIYFIIEGSNRPLSLYTWGGTIKLLGELTLAAGLVAIAAGIWRSARGRCWQLVLNGIALAALGAIYVFFVRVPISFRTIALLVVLMAISAGILELQVAGALRGIRHTADGWVLGLTGTVSVAFALAFLGFVFGWIKLEPGSPGQSFLWLGTYFGFSAMGMMWLALRLHRPDLSRSGQWGGAAPVFGAPTHA